MAAKPMAGASASRAAPDPGPGRMTGLDVDTLRGLAVALGLGLLVGIERERRADAGQTSAGVRTFTLIALAGALAECIGGVGIAVGGAFVVLAALASYRVSRERDPGLTTETAMLVVFLLGVLAMRELALAAALGVAVAVLLASKTRVHHFVRGVLTEQELHDGLLLAAAATIVLPLLPDSTIDPWHVLNLRKLWLLAVIVMVINAAGHVALRLFGARTGLLLAGLAGGFASSTATIASMGARARRNPELATACAGAGVVSNVSTVVQLGVVTGALSPPLLARMWLPLAAAGAVIAVFALAAARTSRTAVAAEDEVKGRAFEPKHALLFVALMATTMLLSAAMLHWFGDAALDLTLALSGLTDVHAAAASAAQLVAVGRIDVAAAMPGIALAFAANSAMKLGMAYATGGRAYLMRLAPGIVCMVLAFALAAWLSR